MFHELLNLTVSLLYSFYQTLVLCFISMTRNNHCQRLKYFDQPNSLVLYMAFPEDKLACIQLVAVDQEACAGHTVEHSG